MPQVSGADLPELEEVRALITRGLRIGVLTYGEIANATAELGLEDADVEDLHALFERCEIELIDEIDPAETTSVTTERGSDKRTRREPRLDLEPAGTTD